MNKHKRTSGSPGMFLGFLMVLAVASFFVLQAVAGVGAEWGLMAATAGGTALTLPDGFVTEFKTGIGEIKTGIEGMRGEIKTLKEENGNLRKEFDEAKGHLDGLRKSSLKLARTIQRPGEVSEECARFVGGIIVLTADKGGKLGLLPASLREKLVDEARAALGIEQKAALTSTDIPLPVQYSGEVIELVTMWGAARQHVTVYPLANASVKLPRLKTSPAFGFVAQSAAIPEKSPQTEWVTFSPSKLGGIIRIPSELDADSIVQIGRFVIRYAARETARMEDLTVFIGDGTATYDSKTGLTKFVNDQSKVTTMAATKTKTSDLTLANARAMRVHPASAVLGQSKYYFHPTMEQLFSSFNTAGDNPYQANAAKGATLDGFPIVWVDALPAYNTAATVSTVFGLFGELSFCYMGVRGDYRFDTSTDVYFATDEIGVRALERFDVQHMATDYVGGVKTAAS